MLGWVLRKGLEGASGQTRTVASDDTTFAEQPDTPAPVFAARAFKSAIFGTPARVDDNAPKLAQLAQHTTESRMDDNDSRTPLKPQGILLTPGTGTSRRKRVSFDHNTVDRVDPTRGKSRSRDNSHGKFPNSFNIQDEGSASKRTRLTETMEKSRRSKSAAGSSPARRSANINSSEEEWEEAEDDDHCMHDITVDLNEPFSRSGKYWKSEFEQYHHDARAEMEKLLKYKQLAKSYAKMKDAEAIDLNEKLKEEQEKIVKMEKKITEMAAQMATRRLDGHEDENPQLMKDLARQTALAVQYRDQLKQVESLMTDKPEDDDADTQSKRRRQAASPRTQKTLLETQRELRRARTQVKENGDLREQVKRLKAELRAAEQRASDSTRGEFQPATNSSLDTDAGLKQAREEIRRKDEEIRRLKEEYEAFQAEAAARQEETKRVLQTATDKISDLKKEIRVLKQGTSQTAAEVKPTTRAASDPIRLTQAKPAPTQNVQKDVGVATGKESFDLVQSLGKRLNERPSHDLGDKFQEQDEPKATTSEDEPAKPSFNILEDRVELERPRWKPFIPRSPRNREHLGTDINQRIQSSSAIPSGATPAPRHRFLDRDHGDIDLLQNRFARLGVPDAEASTMLGANMSRGAIPPERRAAAIARIEQRKAEKRRALSDILNKENVKP
ncbi:hypothetical protein ACHAQH_007406 [Verticillium albo-atrum]